MNLELFFSNHFLSLKPGTSPKTVRLYNLVIRKFGRHLGRSARLADLNDQTISGYMSACVQTGNKAATINGERSKLVSMWRIAQTIGLVNKGPLVQPLPEPEILPRSLSVDELKRLTQSFAKLQGQTGGIENADIIRALFGIQFTTAERIGAVRQLEWSDIQGNVIEFRACIRKGGLKPIVREVPDWVIDHVLKCKTRHRRCFPRMTDNKAAILWSRLFERADVHRRKGKSSHLMRSTHATIVKQNGGDATASLGHSSDVTTRKSYIDPRQMSNQFWSLLPDLDVGD